MFQRKNIKSFKIEPVFISCNLAFFKKHYCVIGISPDLLLLITVYLEQARRIGDTLLCLSL